MTLRRLENFEKLKSNSIFSYILDYNIISPKGIKKKTSLIRNMNEQK